MLRTHATHLDAEYRARIDAQGSVYADIHQRINELFKE